MESKICTMCGYEKPLTDFRKYPGDKDSRYPYCLECQQIETRRRYLVSKIRIGTCTVEEQCELSRIEELYKKRLDKGLRTFGTRNKHKCVRHLVDKQIEDLS